MCAMWNNFQQMHWAMCDGMGSLVRLGPKSIIVAILVAAKLSMGNGLVVSLCLMSCSLHESTNELSKEENGGGNYGD